MLRSSLLLALAAVPLAGDPVSIRPSAQAYCPNALDHEPVLMFERTGGTLMGPVDLLLVVHGNGRVRLADFSEAELPQGGFANVDPEAVSDLMLDLERYGAWIECDDSGMVTDVPLNTITLLKPGTNARSHTHSWWLPEGANGAIEARIELFLDEAFPTR
jgi:hypothetical protein